MVFGKQLLNSFPSQCDGIWRWALWEVIGVILSHEGGSLHNAILVQSLGHVQLFATSWLQHARLVCPSLSPRVCSNSCPACRWCYLTISSSTAPFSFCLPSSPASGSFPISQLFALGGQSIIASASVLPMNVQDLFPLGLTGLISLQSKELSKVFSRTTIQKHQFFNAQPSSWSNSISIHDYWKNPSFEYMDLCWPSDVSAF